MNATWARREQTPAVRRVSRRREISSIVVVTPGGRLYARHEAGAVNRQHAGLNVEPQR